MFKGRIGPAFAGVLLVLGGALGLSTASAQTFPAEPIDTIEFPDGRIVDIYRAEVVRTAGSRLTVRFDNGMLQTYRPPRDFMFEVEGQPRTLAQLKRGDILRAHVTTRGPDSHELVQVIVVPTGGYEVKATATPEPTPAELPETASPMPALGLLGAGLFALGMLGFAVGRRVS